MKLIEFIPPNCWFHLMRSCYIKPLVQCLASGANASWFFYIFYSCVFIVHLLGHTPHPHPESEKAGLKLNIRKTNSIASSPITSWKIDGETMETVRDYSLGFNITADGEYSHEIKRCLLLQRKAVTNLNSIIKSRDMTLPTKVSLIKVIVFPVVMYGCESWTIKKLSTEKLMLLNCGFGEDSWESLGQQGDQTSPS